MSRSAGDRSGEWNIQARRWGVGRFGTPREVGPREIAKVGVGGFLPPRWEDAEPSSRIIPPGERQRIERGGAFHTLMVDGDGFARSADHGAVGAESLGDGIARADDAALEASALVSGDELLVAGNAERVRRRRVEVTGAHQVEVDHRGEGFTG